MKYPLILIALLLSSCGSDDAEKWCPAGTHERRNYSEDGIDGPRLERWCEAQNKSGTLFKNGPYQLWLDGILIHDGQYCFGNQCGCWTFYTALGDLQVERCWTEAGEGCGPFRTYEDGRLVSEENLGPCE